MRRCGYSKVRTTVPTKQQDRRCLSLASTDYILAKAQADRQGIPVSRLMTRALHAYGDPDLVAIAAKDARMRGYPELDPEFQPEKSR